MDYRETSEKRRWFWMMFCATAVIFLSGSLLLSLAGSGELFISPDETANAFFANQFAQTGTLSTQQPFAGALRDQLFPRSIMATQGKLVPVGFLGLPVLYGVFVYFFGSRILLILTPLLALLAALALKRVFTQLFSTQIGNLTALLFLITPAVWYYSARALMPNVLFISLLIFAATHFFCAPLSRHLKRCEKRLGPLTALQKTIDVYVAGMCVGLAIFVRASEAIWIVPTIVLLFFFFRERYGWNSVSRFFIGMTMGILPLLIFNQLTYGSPLVTGYTPQDNSLVAQLSSRTQSFVSQIVSTVFPFGLAPKTALRHFFDYQMGLFWWLTLLTIAGLWLLRKKKTYLCVFFGVSAWLGIWYGSWTIFDNPDASHVTIANSYVRYWLPMTVLALPFMAQTILWIAQRIGRSSQQLILCTVIFFMLFGLSVNAVFFRGQDGLIQVAQTLQTSKTIRDDVLVQTPHDAVFIVDRADKLFFPERSVRYPLRSEATYALLPQIVEIAPLYYYGITFPQADLDYLNNVRLPQLGLRIQYLKTYEEESLYRLTHP